MSHDPSRCPSRRPSRTVLAVVGLTTAAAAVVAVGIPSAGALVPSSSSSAAPRGHKIVADKPAWVAGTKAVGAPAASVEHTLSVVLATDQTGATDYAKSVTDPGSPNYHKFLSPAQYGKKFGASAETVKAAKEWMRSQGFAVGAVDAGRTTLEVTGTTANVNKAFGADLKTFKREKKTVTAPTTSATVPTSVTSIKSVIGMDTTPRYHSDSASTAQRAAGITTSDGSGPVSGDSCSHYWGEQVPPYQEPNKAPFTQPLPTKTCGYTPKELNKVQKVDKVKQTGKGVTVGITMWCDAPTLEADLNRWSGQMGLPKLKNGQVTISRATDPYDDYCDSGVDGWSSYAEVALDAEAVHGAAPDAKMVYSSASGPTDAPLLDSLHRLVDGNDVDIITDSWGAEEDGIDQSTQAAYQQVFTQAAAQGITVLFASGDHGDGSREHLGGDRKTPYPGFPASDPWVTSVGATNIATTNTGKVAFESAWMTAESDNETGSWEPWRYNYGSGGGTSKVFPQPYYQKGVVPTKFAGSTPMRVYPDLANIGDPATGYLVGFTALTNNYAVSSFGGTSLAAPRTAGQLALTLEKTGKRFGFLNPTIYGAGAKQLTDLSSNEAVHAYVSYTSIPGSGLPPTQSNTVLNGQALLDQTLTLDKGYDNLSGMGAIDDQTKLAKLVNPKR